MFGPMVDSRVTIYLFFLCFFLLPFLMIGKRKEKRKIKVKVKSLICKLDQNNIKRKEKEKRNTFVKY